MNHEGILFRYLGEQHAFEAMQSGQLKAGRLSALNDPADCQPVLVGAPPQVDHKARELFAKNYLRNLDAGIGLLSFSSQISDPVLWSHYADAHRGIALGYQLPSALVQAAFEVRYDDNRPTVDYQEAESLKEDKEHPNLFITQIIRSGFTTKATSWSYEKEYRLFVWLHQCDMRGLLYFYDKWIPAPSRIVIGMRCQATDQDVRNALRRRYPNFDKITIERARLHDSRQELTF